jgi:Protein of unknown function (DUF5661)
MCAAARFSADDARQIGIELGIDWDLAPFDVEQFGRGVEVELEHGLQDPTTNVTNDDPVVTGKIALAHLTSFPTTRRGLSRWKTRRRASTAPRDASACHQHVARAQPAEA